MTNVWVPASVTGSAIPTDPSWWTTHDAPRDLTVEHADDGLRVTVPSGDTEITVLGVLPIAQWLPGGTHAERLEAVDAWERTILDLVSAHPDSPVHLLGLTGPPACAAEVLALVNGDRWPTPDADDATTRDARTAPLAVPGAGDDGPRDAFAQALLDAIRPGVRTSWLTVTAGVADAAASFACGTVVPSREGWAAPSVAEAHALRARTGAARDRFVEAGVQLGGCRTALLWPVPVVDGRVSSEVGAEIADEVLRGQLRSPVVWPDGLVELNDLELDVRRRRQERNERETAGRPLSGLSGRELLRLLRRKP